MPSTFGPVAVNVLTGALEYAADEVTQSELDTVSDAAVLKATLTTKGDIYAATAASTPARLAVGSNGQSPVADSTATAGLRWATKAAYARRTAGNFTPASTSWADLTNAMDLTLTARAGDLIQVAAAGFWGNEAVFGYLDVATIVSAAVVNLASSGTGTPSGDGIVGWSGLASAFATVGGPVIFTVAAGDLSSGSVTLRLRVKCSGASTKTLYAVADDPLFFSAVNLGA